MENQTWIFISPHLDDVVLSCGGLVYDLVRAGHAVSVWTLVAGLPTDDNYSPFAHKIHGEWGVAGAEAFQARRAEDQAACTVLGAEVRHFNFLDVIYRQDPQTGEPMVNNNQELFSKPPEENLVEEITTMLTEALPPQAHLVFPIGLGGHVDHQAVVQAGERIGRDRLYYADYPYVLKQFDTPDFRAGTWMKRPYHLDEAALEAWCEAVLCYASQVSMFWRDADETRLALRNYLAGGGGRLWKKR